MLNLQHVAIAPMRPARSTFERRPAIESLESRQMLSATPSAAFIGGAPAVVLPAHAALATIRVINLQSTPAQINLFASSTRELSSSAMLVAQSKPVGAGRKTVRLRFSSSTVGPGNFYMVAQVVPVGVNGASALAVGVAPRRTRFAAATVDLSAAFVREPIGQVYVSASQDTRSYAVVRIANSGTVAAAGMITAVVYASTSSTFDASAMVIGSVSLARARIGAGASRYVQVPIIFKAGTAFGGYTLFAKVDSTLSVAETNFANNLVRSPATIVISQVSPAPHHHHHHDDGGGIDVIDVIDDGSGDYVDVPTDDTGDGAGDSAGGDSGSTPSSTDIGSTTQPDSPTTQPTTQPGDDGTSGDSGSSSDSSGDSGGFSDESLSMFSLRAAPVSHFQSIGNSSR